MATRLAPLHTRDAEEVTWVRASDVSLSCLFLPESELRAVAARAVAARGKAAAVPGAALGAKAEVRAPPQHPSEALQACAPELAASGAC